MTPLRQHLLDVLTLNIGARMASAVLEASAAQSKANLDTLELRELPKLLDAVDRHLLSLLADEKKRDRCMRELRHPGSHATPTPSVNALMTIALLRDEDVMRARSVSRSVAQSLGFSEYRVHVVVSGVVDLAADMLKHTKRGALVFRKLASPKGLEVTAFDSEPMSDDKKNAISTVNVKADEVAVEQQRHLGSTIRATWFVSSNK